MFPIEADTINAASCVITVPLGCLVFLVYPILLGNHLYSDLIYHIGSTVQPPCIPRVYSIT